MKTFQLITHTDLDGTGCAVLMRRHFKIDVTFVDYPDIDRVLQDLIHKPEFLNRSRHLWITDIYPSEEVGREINLLYQDKQLAVQLIDHHATSSYLSHYPWVRHDTSACGTKLLYQHLEQLLGKQALLSDRTEILEFVEAVDAYDRWLLDHPQRAKGEDLNRLLYFYGREDFVEKFSGDLMLSEFDARKVLKYLRMKEERQIVDGMRPLAFFVDSAGREYGITLSAGKPNETADRILANNPNLHYLVMPNPLYGKVELRARGKVDVSEIARRFGGGGHPNAAGFPLDSKRFLFDFIGKLITEERREKDDLPVDRP